MGNTYRRSPRQAFFAALQGGGEESAEQYFKNALYVKPSKTELCKKTVAAEKRITDLSGKSSYSLYISIPFCPTKMCLLLLCFALGGAGAQAYSAVYRPFSEELRQTAEIAKKLSLRLETIYIGGGTPTSVTDKQLEEIMSAVAENFPVQSAAEYTVEAGRPDTVTREKLEVIKRMGSFKNHHKPTNHERRCAKKHRQKAHRRGNGSGVQTCKGMQALKT